MGIVPWMSHRELKEIKTMKLRKLKNPGKRSEHRQVRYRRRIMIERRAAGLCVDCAAPAEGRYRCATCRAVIRAAVQARKAESQRTHEKRHRKISPGQLPTAEARRRAVSPLRQRPARIQRRAR